MDYTNIMLLALGVLGILMHNLVEINKLNHAQNGEFKFASYFKLEWAAMLLSLLVVVAAIIAKTEIRQLEAIGKYLGLAFIAIGYTAQSLLIAFMGKAQKVVDSNNNDR